MITMIEFSSASGYTGTGYPIPDVTYTAMYFNNIVSNDFGITASTGYAFPSSQGIKVRYAGLYRVSFNCTWEPNVAGFRIARILAGAAQFAISTTGSPRTLVTAAGASVFFSQSVTGIVYLWPNDIVTAEVYQSSGGNLNVIRTDSAWPAGGVVNPTLSISLCVPQ